MTETAYDSTAETLKHSLRVGALMGAVIAELVDRSVRHDLSKTEPPELDIFNEFTPKLKTSTYGSEEYKGFLIAMGEGLQHHYAHNRHHPEHFGPLGIAGMTLVDLIEMLADWKAATERHDDGDLGTSLEIQRERFEISDQLVAILRNTAERFGWIASGVGGSADHSPNRDQPTCSVPAEPDDPNAAGVIGWTAMGGPPRPDYGAIWPELRGYVEGAVTDGGQINAEAMLNYLDELKRRVLSPSREWLAQTGGGPRG